MWRDDLTASARELFASALGGDWARFLALVHPEAVVELRSQPGRVLRGRAELEEFVRTVLPAQHAHETRVHTVVQVADDAVVGLGRIYVADAKTGLTDVPVGWLMCFRDGLLVRSWLVDSVEAGIAQLRELGGVRDEPGRRAG